MKKVYIVHLIDTEGPLYEPIGVTFQRVKDEYGYSFDVNYKNLRKLQNKEIDLNGLEDVISRMVSPSRVLYKETWDQIDQMLENITSEKFRKKLTDCDGNGWVYNWLCMDHVGIDGINPRRRDMGFHNIFDHYVDFLDKKNNTEDLIQWHYHPLSITNDAHRCGSTYLNSNHVHSILTRRIIERSWFPSVFRAGHNTQRPDSNFFLEQWIPFDFSNTSSTVMIDHEGMSSGRYGDWRRALKIGPRTTLAMMIIKLKGVVEDLLQDASLSTIGGIQLTIKMFFKRLKKRMKKAVLSWRSPITTFAKWVQMY